LRGVLFSFPSFFFSVLLFCPFLFLSFFCSRVRGGLLPSASCSSALVCGGVFYSSLRFLSLCGLSSLFLLVLFSSVSLSFPFLLLPLIAVLVIPPFVAPPSVR
jgi:hypothetical protein